MEQLINICKTLKGEVSIEHASIIIAISSPHRKDSLEAVNYCIDEVKRTVPIWKKVKLENFPMVAEKITFNILIY